MKKFRIMIWGILCLALLFATACGQEKKTDVVTTEEPATENEETTRAFLENRVAACEITGYKTYEGEHASMFLKEGDRIAVITPSAIASEEQVNATVEGLKAWGYEPVEGKHVRDKTRTLEDCRDDLQWALTDPDIKAIFCVRGGYAASEVMDIMPMEMIADAHKLIIGYSDITIYHSAWSTAGIPSIHASMSGTFTGLPEACVEAEEKILRGELPTYRCESSEFCKEGSAEGILIGGNLTTLISTLQTAYDCTRTDQPYILVLEVIEETIQRQHRFLSILKHMGVLEKAQAIVFAELTDTPADFAASDYDGYSRGGAFTSAEDMICRQFLKDLDIPVAFGFPAGHGDMNYPLLLGEKVRLNVAEDYYTLEY
ncbi:MAG: LD-carboxypeptidase [Lachnospiraceae bacterium]|nr:LD-carboxypeptidase [Lachnospiraceae bacterium]